MESQESIPAAGRPGFAVLVLCGGLLGLAEIVVSSIMRNAGLPYRSAVPGRPGDGSDGPGPGSLPADRGGPGRDRRGGPLQSAGHPGIPTAVLLQLQRLRGGAAQRRGPGGRRRRRRTANGAERRPPGGRRHGGRPGRRGGLLLSRGLRGALPPAAARQCGRRPAGLLVRQGSAGGHGLRALLLPAGYALGRASANRGCPSWADSDWWAIRSPPSSCCHAGCSTAC